MVNAWNWGKTNKVTGGVKIDNAKLELAKQYRSNPTPKEAEVWEWLRAKRLLGLKWRRQQLIDGFIADFYCSELYLALELDGCIHDSEQAQAYDKIRNQVFAAKGIRTLRVSNECTKEELQILIEEVSSPSPFMERGTGGEVANIHYYAVADYLTREEKLAQIVEFKDITNDNFTLQILEPDEHHDWLNQRNDSYQSFIPLECEKKFTGDAKNCVFEGYSCGIQSNRDAWCYNFSYNELVHHMKSHVEFYNEQVDIYEKERGKNSTECLIAIIDKYDTTKIKWSSSLETDLQKALKATWEPKRIYISSYRPFCQNYLYYGDKMIHRVYRNSSLFPTPQSENLVIAVPGCGVKKDFGCIMTNCIPDVQLIQNGQCFPLYYYDTAEDAPKKARGLFDGPISQLPSSGQETRHDGITDWILEKARKLYSPSPFMERGPGGEVTKEDIFYYVYGILHSPKYRETFANDLKKSLPRIPLVEKNDDFWAFSRAGRELGALHVNYETGKMSGDVTVIGEESGNYIVKKMKFDKDKRILYYNADIRIENIPLEVDEYIVNGRSALGWLVDQYQVSTDKASGIVNDPNDWAHEHNYPRYILDLVLRIIELSVRTVNIVKELPELSF